MATKRSLMAALCILFTGAAANAQTQSSSVDDISKAYGEDSEKIGLVSEYSDHAILAWAVYGDERALSLAADRGWDPKSYIIRDRRKLKPKPTARPSDDVFAVLFRKGNPRGFDPNDQYVVAFRGSDFKKIEDWIVNGQVVLPILPEDRVDEAAFWAKKFEGAVAENHPGELRKFDFAGHSLGGRLAMVARHATGRDAVVFNSSPLSDREIGYLVTSKAGSDSKLVAFRSPLDPLALADPQFAKTAIEIENVDRATVIDGFREVYPNSLVPDESGAPDPDFTTAGSTPAVVEKQESDLQFVDWMKYNHSVEVLANAMQEVRTALPLTQQQQPQVQQQQPQVQQQQPQARTATSSGGTSYSPKPAQKPRDCGKSDELTRDLAACLLAQSASYPKEVKHSIWMSQGEIQYRPQDIGSKHPRLQSLQRTADRLAASGLVTVSYEIKPRRAGGKNHVFSIDFTDQGRVWVRSYKKRNMSRVVTFVGNFGEVTGIFYLNESKSIAQVEYTDWYDRTPFGMLLPFDEFRVSEIVLEPKPIETKQATLKLWDDGWRVAR